MSELTYSVREEETCAMYGIYKEQCFGHFNIP